MIRPNELILAGWESPIAEMQRVIQPVSSQQGPTKLSEPIRP